MNIQVVQIPGTPFIALAQDQSITRFCMQTGRLDWDQSIAAHPAIRSRLQPGAVVIDAGAYIGDTTKLFERFGCFVYAIEPRDDAFVVLQHNCPQCICIKRPLGRRGQKVSFSNALSNTEASNLGGRQVQVDDKSNMTCMALDELNPHRCDFLKMDVEGFEPHALEGAAELITRTRPVLHVEVNLPALQTQGFNGMEAVYDIVRSWNYSIEPRQPERIGTGTPWDIVCVPQ